LSCGIVTLNATLLFLSSINYAYKKIYPSDLELKCEHHRQHATFLDLDITISDGVFVYKLYDKRDKFPFFAVHMRDTSSNITSYIFYGTIMSKMIRIAISTLLLHDLIPKMGALFKRMLNQGDDRQKIVNQYKKAIINYSNIFNKFVTRYELIIEKIMKEI